MKITDELKWLAGIIDSEGSFSISLRVSERYKMGAKCHILKIITTDSVIVPKICAMFNSPMFLKQPSGEAKSVANGVAFTGFKLRSLLPLIIPYLYIKQPQSKIMLKAINIKNGESSPYTMEENRLWDSLKNAMTELNLRGKDAPLDIIERDHQFTWPWVAGLVDGDGSIYVDKCLRRYKGKISGETNRPTLKITLAHPKTIEYLCDKFNINSLKAGKVRGNRRLTTSMRLLFKNLSRILPKIEPYLVLKREKAKLAMRICGLRESLTSGGKSDADKLKINQINEAIKELKLLKCS